MLPTALLYILAAQGPQEYKEPYRPQFHFTSKTNWLNDPNGLVFYKGTYHLFFQHNPIGNQWGNMTWGHAESQDLVHWKQLPDAIQPDALGTIFSGSAVVDWRNTTRFQQGKETTLVAIYACAGDTSPESKGKPFTQCLACSTDAGKTWSKFAGNPALPQVAPGNRDPKVIWYSSKGDWIMALYLEAHDYALFASPDLKHWRQLQRFTFPGASECPDFFEIPVANAKGEKKWVFVSASGEYLVGSFDGARFTPEQGGLKMDQGTNFYAVQTYSDIPPKDGRRIQIAWMSGGSYPGMPFNQQMSFPCELKLFKSQEGYRIHRWPVREIRGLNEETFTLHDKQLLPGTNLLSSFKGDLWDITMDVSPQTAAQIFFGFRGMKLTYDVPSQMLRWADHTIPMPLVEGHLKLRILIDRTSFELFGNDGERSCTCCFLPIQEDKSLLLTATGGAANAHRIKVIRLKSGW